MVLIILTDLKWKLDDIRSDFQSSTCLMCQSQARYEPTLVLHGLSKESSGFKGLCNLFTSVHLNLSQRTNYIQHG